MVLITPTIHVASGGSKTPLALAIAMLSSRRHSPKKHTRPVSTPHPSDLYAPLGLLTSRLSQTRAVCSLIFVSRWDAPRSTLAEREDGSAEMLELHAGTAVAIVLYLGGSLAVVVVQWRSFSRLHV